MKQTFSNYERFLMNFKLYQFWRFLVLNLKIYIAATRSKLRKGNAA